MGIVQECLIRLVRQMEAKEIQLGVKHNYSLLENIFCCRCFPCLKADNNSLLTADNRKLVIQKMLAKSQENIELNPHNTVLDPLQLMIMLFISDDKRRPIQLLRYCRLNINLALTDSNRTDVEFYIPQLCNYVVFHEEFHNHEMIDMMEAACRCDFYFAHQYYLYLNSLERANLQHGQKVFEPVKKYKIDFLRKLEEHYSDWMMYTMDLDIPLSEERAIIKDIIAHYGTPKELKQYIFVEVGEVHRPYYPSLYYQDSNFPASTFKSMINFFQDLFAINNQVTSMKRLPKESRKTTLKILLQQVNGQLPACVYIPFTKGHLRRCNVLNIVVEETNVFNTKDRCLYSITLQVYNPNEILDEAERKSVEKELESPITIYNSMPKYRRESQISCPGLISQPQLTNNSLIPMRSIESKRSIRRASSQHKHRARTPGDKSEYQQNTCATVVIPEQVVAMKENILTIFGESEEIRKERIRSHSIFGHLKSWNMITLIVKTGDNLKQEQFGLQLIQQFDYIFKMEKLGLLLTTYEVLSMGMDFGIIEMVKDCVTLDKLYRTLKECNMEPTLAAYFHNTFEGKQLDKALNNFCKSLAAYSLVTYFLQLKDRHNGNIMLHRCGKLLHIDFGFFLSNTPGKGVELEKSVPFKLNSQYVDVLGGVKSKYFQKFRKYFFKGFEAARKHQDRILILVKMIYSSSGTTMACFIKGENSITDIEDRFNPPGVTNQVKLSEFCQNLINQSLDNWASKWYDKYQYWAQGILY